ncbi:hypothetical protein GGX14DRAFT_381565 [Mycena pura]|uniref:Microbial-type PARG catalytic domain-containing protein n=1 Tax=Mycena pura TaxID=153505 RepID=A0AAD6Y0I2_9AGAR|nr:hypothetical protein GGX14DRAFT_381565 [Mycena pura]
MSSRTLNAAAPAIVARPRDELKQIARDTLAAVKRGSYTTHIHLVIFQDLATVSDSTTSFGCDALDDWEISPSPKLSGDASTDFVLYQATTLEGIRFCLDDAAAGDFADIDASRTGTQPPHLAVLNFASATSPGGGFLGGARAQEETLARSSNLYSSLSSAAARPFYTAHNTRADPRFSHVMLLTRSVRFVRDDRGVWVPPADVDVLTSAAVNVNALRQALHPRGGKEAPLPAALAAEVAALMRERMSRILCAMARAGATVIVLGSFGTGAFRNKVEFVAETWAELLCGVQAPFRGSSLRLWTKERRPCFATCFEERVRVFGRRSRNGRKC